MKTVYIEAPAGYGKTEELVRIVASSNEDRKVLLLTHTRAGVAAIQKRLDKHSVPRSKYEIATIASFCMSWCKAYPKTSGFLYCLPYQYGNISHYYVDIHNATATLLEKEWMKHIIRNAYSQVIIDEYQDCTVSQNKLLFYTLASIIPTTILGDPLQGIFYFPRDSEAPCDLYSISQKCDSVQHLNTPWRWKATNPQLGDWISEIRSILFEADKSNSGTSLVAPNPCEFISYISPQKFREDFFKIASEHQSIAFIARNEKTQSFLSRQTGGRYAFHEKKDNEELTKTLHQIDLEETPLSFYIDLYRIAFTHVDKLKTMQNKLAQNDFSGWHKNKNPDLLALFKDLNEISFSDVERVLRYQKIKEILQWIRQKDDFHCVRNKFYSRLLQIIDNAIIKNISLTDSYNSLYSYAEDNIPNAVSTRTVLSKGLEFDAVIIDISGEIDKQENTDSPKSFYGRMSRGELNWDVRNFYVAVSRAKQKIYFIGEPNQNIRLKKYRKPV